MKRTATVLATTIVAAMTLTGCGGASDYCETVETNKASLNTFGQKRTDAAYAKYATVFADVAKVAPASVKKNWTALSEATDGVIEAQKTAGVKLEDMTDQAKVKKLSKDELKQLNDAYKAFNATTKQRTAVVKNVLQECDIRLK